MKFFVLFIIIAVLFIYSGLIIEKTGLDKVLDKKPAINEEIQKSGFLGYFDPNRVKSEFQKEIEEAKAEAGKGKEFLFKFSINRIKSSFPLNLIFR